MKSSPTHSLRSECPIAAVLDIFGDKWTFLIVRDIVIYDRHKFNEFAGMDENIPTNLLADRLKRLVAHDVLERRVYQEHPVRYEYHLTEKGQDIVPIMHDMIQWGLKYVPGVGPDASN